jgi:hypothetical protein
VSPYLEERGHSGGGKRVVAQLFIQSIVHDSLGLDRIRIIDTLELKQTVVAELAGCIEKPCMYGVMCKYKMLACMKMYACMDVSAIPVLVMQMLLAGGMVSNTVTITLFTSLGSAASNSKVTWWLMSRTTITRILRRRDREKETLLRRKS